MANPTVERTIKRDRRQNQGFTEFLGEELGLDMMLIPANSFMMGSPEDELERLEREGPQHPVSVGEFFMGRYPITQAQWRFVAELPQVDTNLELSPSNWEGDDRPVVRVNWFEAVEFCQRLSAYTKRDYRLPSEAEWEYACRAGTNTPFHFGPTISPKLANYKGSVSYNGGPTGDASDRTTPVHSFKVANRFGLCDMHGNVWEWCQDVWHENYEGEKAPIDCSAWVEGGNQDRRIIRGGSWACDPRICRSAYRNYSNPGSRNNDIGFRVVCSAP